MYLLFLRIVHCGTELLVSLIRKENGTSDA